MNVTVTLPTTGKSNESLTKMLQSLSNQSYRNFKLKLILLQDFIDFDDINLILEGLDFDYEFVRQDGKGFENAMNSVIKHSSGITINTDDDAIYPPDHISKYVKAFENENVGVIGGLVNGRLPYINRTRYLMLINRLSNSSRLSPIKKNYSTFFNSCGLLSININKFFTGSSQSEHYLSPMGVNMGWVENAVKGFKLMQYSKKGTLNESYLSLYAINNGYEVISDPNIDVVHIHEGSSSLSSSSNRFDDFVKLTEFFFSPLLVNRILPVEESIVNGLIRKFKILLPPGETKKAIFFILKKVTYLLNNDYDEQVLKNAYNETLSSIKSLYINKRDLHN